MPLGEFRAVRARRVQRGPGPNPLDPFEHIFFLSCLCLEKNKAFGSSMLEEAKTFPRGASAESALFYHPVTVRSSPVAR